MRDLADLPKLPFTMKDTLRQDFPYGMFTGGHGYHDGAERLGCMVPPPADRPSGRSSTS